MSARARVRCRPLRWRATSSTGRYAYAIDALHVNCDAEEELGHLLDQVDEALSAIEAEEATLQ